MTHTEVMCIVAAILQVSVELGEPHHPSFEASARDAYKLMNTCYKVVEEESKKEFQAKYTSTAKVSHQ